VDGRTGGLWAALVGLSEEVVGWVCNKLSSSHSSFRNPVAV
jgi:hypothetical protein